MKKNEQQFPTEKVCEDLLGQLISIDTQNPPGREGKITEFIIRYLDLDGRDYEILDHGHQRKSLILNIPGKKKETILFVAHMDTVPAGNRERWNTSPLTATRSGDHIYGLGASDMKSGLTAYLILAKHILQSGCREKTFRFVFTADEENGSMGIKKVRQKNVLQNVSMVFVAEPTNGRPVISEKGLMWVRVQVIGKQAHGSMPFLAKNANEYLWEAIQSVERLLAGCLPHSILGKLTVSPTIFQGGNQKNIIPGEAQAVLDIRTVQKTDHQTVYHVLRSIVGVMEQKNQVRLLFEVENEKFPMHVSEENHEVQKFVSLIPKSTDREVMGIPYYTDLAELLKETDLPFLIFGPGQIEQMHRQNEWVSLKNIQKVTEIYLDYIEKYC